MDLLNGTRIVSFNHFLMGPVGIQLLADLGADVIAVEPLGGAFQRKWGGANKSVDGQSVLFLAGNRNKRSLALDLKSPAGIEIARKLVARADVVAENFRPGVMDRLGLGFEALKADNPGLIYAAASGYGPDGPYAERPGQDLLVQAISGLMAITGSQEQGARAVGVSAADHHGAALLAMGILAALVRRGRDGRGCRVDVSLLSASIDLQLESFVCYLNGARPETVRQPRHIAGWYFPAPYGIYRTEDGEVAISLADMGVLSEALGLPELAAVTHAEAFERNEALAELIAGAVAGKTTAAWLEIFERHRIWHAPVNDYDAVVADPQVAHNRNFVTVPGATGAPVTLVTHPVRYDGEVPEVRLPPQALGAQSAEILGELGYSATEIERLAAAGAIGLPEGA
ncbi:MAG: CoA transferase [Proteobacteria bacterium]|nr:CoA transferase [Pseudomonadota bacterium]